MTLAAFRGRGRRLSPNPSPATIARRERERRKEARRKAARLAAHQAKLAGEWDVPMPAEFQGCSATTIEAMVAADPVMRYRWERYQRALRQRGVLTEAYRELTAAIAAGMIGQQGRGKGGRREVPGREVA